jgi:hypothetical protein
MADCRQHQVAVLRGIGIDHHSIDCRAAEHFFQVCANRDLVFGLGLFGPAGIIFPDHLDPGFGMVGKVAGIRIRVDVRETKHSNA